MKKFRILFIFSLVFALFTFFIQPSFAANEMHSVGNALGTAAEDVSNVVRSGSDAVTGAASSIGDAVEDTAEGAKNTMEDSGRKIENEASSMTSQMRDSDDYTATQTSTRMATGNTEPTLFGMNATMWTWMIVILTAIGIGSLIWFYNSAKSEIRDHK